MEMAHKKLQLARSLLAAAQSEIQTAGGSLQASFLIEAADEYVSVVQGLLGGTARSGPTLAQWIAAARASRITAIEMLSEAGGIGVLDAKALVDALAQAATAAAAPPVVEPPLAATQRARSLYELYLSDAGTNKVRVIKAIRAIANLGFKAARDLVENAPSEICSGLSKRDAQQARKALVAAGATAAIRAYVQKNTTTPD